MRDILASQTHGCEFFFFQAEDGIRDYKVTGVQTCALPICYHVDCLFPIFHERYGVEGLPLSHACQHTFKLDLGSSPFHFMLDLRQTRSRFNENLISLRFLSGWQIVDFSAFQLLLPYSV